MTILRKQFLEHVGQTSPSPMMIEVARAEGVFFYTPSGKRYFDLIAGVSVNNVGHANPQVVEAVRRQAGEYMHVMVYGELIQRPQVELAAKLAQVLPTGLESVYFLNSGSEAVEGALKLAKRYTGRTELISFCDAYHGSTQGSMSVLGGEEYKYSYRPLLPDVNHLNYNSTADLSHITARTAGVLIEPVQGEAGVRLPEPGYLDALRARCSEVGALLIFDEIQTGFGRTGAMFAMQRYGVTPDIACLGKALGGGMPLGAFVSSRAIMNTLTFNPVLGHITTFGGHPVCCAAGLASLEYILDNDLTAGVESKGSMFEAALSVHPAVVQVRRCGLLMAVELGSSERMFTLMSLFAEHGILSDWFLFCDTAFRISPPLTITRAQIEECCQTIVACLDRLG